VGPVQWGRVSGPSGGGSAGPVGEGQRVQYGALSCSVLASGPPNGSPNEPCAMSTLAADFRCAVRLAAIVLTVMAVTRRWLPDLDPPQEDDSDDELWIYEDPTPPNHDVDYDYVDNAPSEDDDLPEVWCEYCGGPLTPATVRQGWMPALSGALVHNRCFQDHGKY